MKLFKSRKTYYLYNPNTLNYERVSPSSQDRVFTILRHLTTGIAFGIATFFVMMYVMDSPMESQLRKENRLMQTQYEVLSLRLNAAMEVLEDIQLRDETLYRAIFQAESIPESVRKAGFGGSNRYAHLTELSNSELIISTTQKMDMLRKQLYVQSNSLEELIRLGQNQEERSMCIPAIQPIANKDLKKTASGYGMRIDPIYRTPRFHAGMDFSAKVGTDIYATGNGTITYVQRFDSIRKKDIPDLEKFGRDVQDSMWHISEQICENEGTRMRIDHGIELWYKYISLDGEDMMTVKAADRSTCEDLDKIRDKKQSNFELKE